MTVTPEELDALRELINIGVGRAAGSLNAMIGRAVQLNVPSVVLLEPDDTGWVAGGDTGRKLASVHLSFDGGLRGSADLVFPSESGSKLVALLTGEDVETADLDAVRAATLTEVGNILLNGFLGAITNLVREHVEYELPIYLEESAEQIERSLRSIPDSAVLLAQAQFFIGCSPCGLNGERIDGEVTLLMGVDSLERLLIAVQRAGEEMLM